MEIRRLPDGPTTETIIVFVVVFLIQQLGGFVGIDKATFALATPLSVRPWTLVTSIYAHWGVAHLATNAVSFLVLGFVLEQTTTRLRFHAFVIATGMIAGVIQVFASELLGRPAAVLGASGAIFAMLGYVITSNPVADSMFTRVDVSRKAQVTVFVVLAAGVALVTGAARVALFAHFTGFLLGLLAGRVRLLRTDTTGKRKPHIARGK